MSDLLQELVGKEALYTALASRFEDDANIDADYVIKEVLEPVFKEIKTAEAIPVEFIQRCRQLYLDLSDACMDNLMSEVYKAVFNVLGGLLDMWEEVNDQG